MFHQSARSLVSEIHTHVEKETKIDIVLLSNKIMKKNANSIKF